MRILIVALGTRGDVQPMLAIGQALRARGHAVRVLAGSNFEAWVRGCGFDYAPMLDMEAAMSSEGGADWLQSQGMAQLRAMKAMLNTHRDGIIEPVNAATPDADLVLTTLPGAPFTFYATEKYDRPLINIFFQPLIPTRYPVGMLKRVTPFPSPINYGVGLLVQRVLSSIAGDAIAEQKRRLGLPVNSRSREARARSLPTLYPVSPQILPPPPDYPANAHVCGYWFLDEGDAYQPPPELEAFLAAGAPPIYIGFGSMADPDPAHTLSMMLGAISQTGARVVLAAGWSAWGEHDLPANTLMIKGAPHDWLFPRMAAVVHHGGCGTTGAGLRAGKPTFIIPHIADQPYWGRRVHELGLGPAPVARQKMTADTLAYGIDALMRDRAMHERAAAIGARIRQEDGIGTAVALIEAMSSR